MCWILIHLSPHSPLDTAVAEHIAEETCLLSLSQQHSSQSFVLAATEYSSSSNNSALATAHPGTAPKRCRYHKHKGHSTEECRVLVRKRDKSISNHLQQHHKSSILQVAIAESTPASNSRELSNGSSS